jgi:hypothetical protein
VLGEPNSLAPPPKSSKQPVIVHFSGLYELQTVVLNLSKLKISGSNELQETLRFSRISE